MEAPEKIYIHPDIGGREFLSLSSSLRQANIKINLKKKYSNF